MSDIRENATVIHLSRTGSYGHGKVLEIFPASEQNPEPAASVQFDGDLGYGPRTVRVAHLTVERAVPMAVRLPIAPKLRVVYSATRANPVDLPPVVA